MLSEFVQSLCEILVGLPLVGGLIGNVCTTIVEVLTSLGL